MGIYSSKLWPMEEEWGGQPSPMDAFHETKVYYNSEEIDLHYVVWYVSSKLITLLIIYGMQEW